MSGVRLIQVPYYLGREHADLSRGPARLADAIGGESVVIERPTYVAISMTVGSIANVTVDTTLQAGWDAVQINGAMTLTRIRVREAAGTAIRTNVANVAITQCEITGSGAYGVYVSNNPSTVSVTTCDLVGNANNAVHNVQNTSGSVNASNNYWGGGSPALDQPNGVSAGVTVGTESSTPYGYTFPQ